MRGQWSGLTITACRRLIPSPPPLIRLISILKKQENQYMSPQTPIEPLNHRIILTTADNKANQYIAGFFFYG